MVQDFAFPLQEAQVQSLVGELRSHRPQDAVKKIKNQQFSESWWERQEGQRPLICLSICLLRLPCTWDMSIPLSGTSTEGLGSRTDHTGRIAELEASCLSFWQKQWWWLQEWVTGTEAVLVPAVTGTAKWGPGSGTEKGPCCTVETNTTLKVNCTPIKLKKIKWPSVKKRETDRQKNGVLGFRNFTSSEVWLSSPLYGSVTCNELFNRPYVHQTITIH